MPVRQSSARRRALAAFVLLTGAIAACDAGVTAPPPAAEIRATPVTPAAIEGDTLACGTRGWVIITGVYVCNGDG